MATLQHQMKMREKEIQRAIDAAIKKNAESATDCANEGNKRVRQIVSSTSKSAPGKPPALKTGFLRDSVITVPARPGNPAVAAYGPTAPYAASVEFGHGGKNKAAPHPFMRKLAADADFHKFITNTVANRWRDSIQRSANGFKNLGNK